MNILINDFNLVIADDYLREYAAFDAHKNKDELFDLIDRITRNRKSSFSSKNLTALSLAFFYTIHERWAFEKCRRRTPEEESAQVPAANPAAGMMFACA